MSLIWMFVTSQNVRNCAKLFKVWKDRWVLTSYRDTLCWSLFGMQVFWGYWGNVQVRVENVSWFCFISNELDITTAWKFYFIKQKLSSVQRMYAVGYDLVFRNEKNLSAGKNSWTIIFAEFGKVFIPLTGSFFLPTQISISFVCWEEQWLKLIFSQCWYKLSQFIPPHIHYAYCAHPRTVFFFQV